MMWYYVLRISTLVLRYLRPFRALSLTIAPGPNANPFRWKSNSKKNCLSDQWKETSLNSDSKPFYFSKNLNFLKTFFEVGFSIVFDVILKASWMAKRQFCLCFQIIKKASFFLGKFIFLISKEFLSQKQTKIRLSR